MPAEETSTRPLMRNHLWRQSVFEQLPLHSTADKQTGFSRQLVSGTNFSSLGCQRPHIFDIWWPQHHRRPEPLALKLNPPLSLAKHSLGTSYLRGTGRIGGATSPEEGQLSLVRGRFLAWRTGKACSLPFSPLSIFPLPVPSSLIRPTLLLLFLLFLLLLFFLLPPPLTTPITSTIDTTRMLMERERGTRRGMQSKR